MKKTIFDKVWDSHVVQQVQDGPDILFIDRHMVHEVTSPVAFLGLKTETFLYCILSALLRQQITILPPLTSTFLWKIHFRQIN